MRLEHHLVGGYVRYISPYIIIIKYEPAERDITYVTGPKSALTEVKRR